MLEFAQNIGGSAKFSVFTGDVVEGRSQLVYDYVYNFEAEMHAERCCVACE
jgi:hypothetical protein